MSGIQIGVAIRARRLAANLYSFELAALAKMPAANLSQLETGKRGVQIGGACKRGRPIERIAAQLGCTVADLVKEGEG